MIIIIIRIALRDGQEPDPTFGGIVGGAIRAGSGSASVMDPLLWIHYKRGFVIGFTRAVCKQKAKGGLLNI